MPRSPLRSQFAANNYAVVMPKHVYGRQHMLHVFGCRQLRYAAGYAHRGDAYRALRNIGGVLLDGVVINPQMVTTILAEFALDTGVVAKEVVFRDGSRVVLHGRRWHDGMRDAMNEIVRLSGCKIVEM